jgi:hypothetical protein
MATTTESLSGEGQVFVRETGEVIGRFPFRLRTYQRPCAWRIAKFSSILGVHDVVRIGSCVTWPSCSSIC